MTLKTKSMEIIRISSERDVLFPVFLEMYETAFPLCERRCMEDQAVILGNKAYSLDVWTEDGDVIGFIGWWDCGEWRFVEHYAINTPYRSLGYGSRLLSGWMKQSQLPVLLEIEPVVDGLTLRRQRFYHRLGFVDNISVKHRQPPYHKGDAPLDLWLMSYPCKITDTAYERFYFMQKTEIMPQF